MCRVAVLMSTYNGKKYLKEQLDSILAQKDVDVTLYIRDDGSSDETVEIVRKCQKLNSNINLSIGKNIGVGNSFMQLIYDVPNDYDFYAFADQDDVWLTEKLTKAVNKIGTFFRPVLYCSNQILVDEKLNIIGPRYSHSPNTSYQQIMCQNKIAGCTMVWNQALLKLLADENKRPSELLLKNRMHDVWVAMVCSITGDVIYDDESYIYYRQHECNVVGVRKTNTIKQRMQKLKDTSYRNGRSLLCREVYERYEKDIVSEKIKDQLAIYAYYAKNKQYKKIMLRDSSLSLYTSESLLEYKLKVWFNLI